MRISRPDSAPPSIFDAYPVRVMLGLVASLSLLLALVHLPVQSPVQRVGWSTQSPTDRIALSDIDTERSSDEPDAEAAEEPPPVTEHQPPQSNQTVESASGDDPTAGSSSSDAGETSDLDEVRSVAALGTSDRRPQLVGGMGSLYLSINYPAKAREQGIEGRMQLKFTVRPDGSVTNINVAESLHPLCDSAAVKGLQSVEFVPAKIDGDPVPVRIRLPVRFKLTAVTSRLDPNDSDR